MFVEGATSGPLRPLCAPSARWGAGGVREGICVRYAVPQTPKGGGALRRPWFSERVEWRTCGSCTSS